jgi:hypothetical protein
MGNEADDSGVSEEEEEAPEQPSRRDRVYACTRCTFVDQDGSRCEHWGARNLTATDGVQRCVTHGGKKRCVEVGCREWTYGRAPFCPAHQGPCMADGCSRQKQNQAGYCTQHAFLHKYEWVLRRERLAGLRDKWLDVILAEQGGRCACSVRTCEVVDDGDATPRCPWGKRALPTDAAELDHIKPLSEEGEEDDRDNLQVLCACCHAMKTHAERRALAAAKRETRNRKYLETLKPRWEKGAEARLVRMQEKEAERDRTHEERAVQRAEKRRREEVARIMALGQKPTE